MDWILAVVLGTLCFVALDRLRELSYTGRLLTTLDQEHSTVREGELMAHKVTISPRLHV